MDTLRKWLRPARGPMVQSEPPLRKAVGEAQLLLNFAARRGIALDDGVIAAVVTAAAALKQGNAAVEAETAFWPAYRALAEAVKPASVGSVLATRDSHAPMTSTLLLWLRGTEMSLARWAVFRFRWLGIMTLLLIIAFQIFWGIGASIKADVLDLERQIASRQLQRAERIERLQSENQEIPSDAVLGRIDAEINERQQWLEGTYFMLVDWNRKWAWFMFFVDLPMLDPDNQALTPPARARIELISADFVLTALSSFALPFLYGLLGACAYVLRDLAKEIRQVTLSQGSNIRYGLRLSLGPLAGLAVGWFIAPEAPLADVAVGLTAALSGNTVEQAASEAAAASGENLSFRALSPLALAFLAGYSVELVFNAMDRVIAAFTGEKSVSQG